MGDIKTIISPDTLRENRVPPGQHVTAKWPVLHHGAVPRIDISKWQFKISGLVSAENTLTYQEFIELPRINVLSDIHCVTGWSRLQNTWEGPATGIIKDLTTVYPEAKYVVINCVNGFTTNMPVSDFFEADALFAVKHDAEELTPDHGYPLRLVIPRLYFYKSAKWVTGVEFVEKDRPGFWESSGYHNRGNPWKEERYSSQP
jgi:DMSO/TMAO reductase YedYZ molybdopterin-dependent catalytic subunit